jgi:hypothetical protein
MSTNSETALIVSSRVSPFWEEDSRGFTEKKKSAPVKNKIKLT